MISLLLSLKAGNGVRNGFPMGNNSLLLGLQQYVGQFEK